MLKDLDDIDWKTLKHAFGRAQEVPKLLRAFAEASADQRAQAFGGLSLCLECQGERFSASAAAVPFLLEIATTRAAQSRALALVLLAHIGCGSLLTVAHGCGEPPGVRSPSAKALARQCYDAVSVHQASYLQLLGDDDAAVRGAAAFLLACTSFDLESASNGLRTAVHSETSVFAKSCMLLALAVLARELGTTSDEAFLSQRLGDAAEPVLVRGTAAIALRWLGCPPSDEQAKAIAALVALGDLGQERFPWNRGEVYRLAVDVLAQRNEDERLLAARALMDAAGSVASSSEPGAALPGALANSAFELVLGHRRQSELLPNEMNSQRRALLVQAVHQGLLGLVGVRPADFGLPTDPRDARRLLGLDPPGPLDREILLVMAGAQVRWPTWKALHAVRRGGLRVDQLETAMDAALSPEEIVAVYAEAAINVYGTSLPAEEGWHRALERAGQRAASWAVPFARYLVHRSKEGSLRLTSSAAILVLTCIVHAGLEPEPELDPLVSVAFAAGTPARDVVLAIPPSRRDAIFVQLLSEFRDAGAGVHFLAPLLAMAPTERMAEVVVQSLSRIDDDRSVRTAADVLVTMGSVARPVVERALRHEACPHRERLRAALARMGA